MTPIFVVLFRNPEIESRCLQAVERCLPDRAAYPLVVHDNGQENRSLAVVWNELLECRGRPDIAAWIDEPDPVGVLLNTDCFVEPGTIERLEAVIRSHPRLAFTGPMTDHAGSHQAVGHPFWVNAGAERLGDPKGPFRDQVKLDEYVSGFCLCFRRQAWLDAGKFPEDGPFYGQESALVYAARQKGWRTAIALDCFAEHLGGATCRRYLDQDAERKRGGEWFRGFRERIGGKKPIGERPRA